MYIVQIVDGHAFRNTFSSVVTSDSNVSDSNHATKKVFSRATLRIMGLRSHSAQRTGPVNVKDMFLH